MVILLISGELAVGKTSVSSCLAEWLPATHLKVRNVLVEILGADITDRQTLQRRGADLDRRTSGRWLIQYLEDQGMDNVVIDSLRTLRQAVPILESLTAARLVYLEAHESTRRYRYAASIPSDPVKASTGFDIAMLHPTEIEVRKLRALADVVLATDDLSVQTVADEIVKALGLTRQA